MKMTYRMDEKEKEEKDAAENVSIQLFFVNQTNFRVVGFHQTLLRRNKLAKKANYLFTGLYYYRE